MDMPGGGSSEEAIWVRTAPQPLCGLIPGRQRRRGDPLRARVTHLLDGAVTEWWDGSWGWKQQQEAGENHFSKASPQPQPIHPSHYPTLRAPDACSPEIKSHPCLCQGSHSHSWGEGWGSYFKSASLIPSGPAKSLRMA